MFVKIPSFPFFMISLWSFIYGRVLYGGLSISSPAFHAPSPLVVRFWKKKSPSPLVLRLRLRLELQYLEKKVLNRDDKYNIYCSRHQSAPGEVNFLGNDII